MKYFSHGNQYINAECQNCGRVLKIPYKKCIAVSGGFSVRPSARCQCGTVSNFIEDKSSDYQKNTGGARTKNNHHVPELIDLIERFLPLQQWGFKNSAQYVNYLNYDSNYWNSVETAQNYHGLGYPVIFYDSEKCRIRFFYDTGDRYDGHSIRVHYGRLETPDTANILLTNTDQQSYHLYWHSVYDPLYFLDGLSPQEARSSKKPKLIVEFEQSDLAKSTRYSPERDILLHAAIWEVYGKRLFDIFDADNTDLWKQYTAFVNNAKIGKHGYNLSE